MDQHGSLITDQALIGDLFIGVFSYLFTSSNPSAIASYQYGMETTLLASMHSKLLLDFTKLEVKEAVFQMTPLSSPNSNGFPTQFYQVNWATTRKDACQFVLQVLNQGGSLKSFNDTFITLIPKIKEPKKVYDFRPISLYNVIYKIVSKVLANRLNKVLHEIISLNQSAFVPGMLFLIIFL